MTPAAQNEVGHAVARASNEQEGEQLSWAAYALDGRVNVDYWRSERVRAGFRPGAFLVDVGCGNGWILAEFLARGCRGIGTEVYEGLVEQARARGCDAVRAPAEALPVETASCDGAIFSGVLPFTDEDAAFAELARVLRPGGRLESYYLGPGFAVREMLLGRSLRRRYYGARALVNTILMSVVGRKLPGKYGNVVFVTHRRLAALYARHGFALQLHTPSPTFLGLSVFIYHTADRVSGRQADRG
jgi:SAM-dependent methyltransferase